MNPNQKEALEKNLAAEICFIGHKHDEAKLFFSEYTSLDQLIIALRAIQQSTSRALRYAYELESQTTLPT